MSEPPARPRVKGSRYTIQGLMLFVLLIALGLGVVLNLPRNPNPRDWRDRVVSLHVLAVGFLIPLGTAMLYLAFAAPVLDPRDKKERMGLTFAAGCLFTVAALGSLLFWVITMSMVRD